MARDFAPLVGRSDAKRENLTSTIAGYILQDHLRQISWGSHLLPARNGRISIAMRCRRWHIPELESRRVFPWKISVRRECSQFASGISIVLAKSPKRRFRKPTMKFAEWALVPMKLPSYVDSASY